MYAQNKWQSKKKTTISDKRSIPAPEGEKKELRVKYLEIKKTQHGRESIIFTIGGK